LDQLNAIYYKSQGTIPKNEPPPLRFVLSQLHTRLLELRTVCSAFRASLRSPICNIDGELERLIGTVESLYGPEQPLLEERELDQISKKLYPIIESIKEIIPLKQGIEISQNPNVARRYITYRFRKGNNRELPYLDGSQIKWRPTRISISFNRASEILSSAAASKNPRDIRKEDKGNYCQTMKCLWAKTSDKELDLLYALNTQLSETPQTSQPPGVSPFYTHSQIIPANDEYQDYLNKIEVFNMVCNEISLYENGVLPTCDIKCHLAVQHYEVPIHLQLQYVVPTGNREASPAKR